MKKARKKVVSRRIVVDASVVSAASLSNSGTHPGPACRLALQTILDICHRVVVSPDLQDEYRRHLSRFASKWLTSMYARKKVVKTNATPQLALVQYASSPESQKHRTEIVKDLHLVQAALDTDSIILSGDNKAKALFSQCHSLKGVVWITPDGASTWLERGALHEQAPTNAKYPYSNQR